MRIRATISIALFLFLSVSAWTSSSANAQETSISGVVWEDLNLDGQRQSDEPALANIGLQIFGPITGSIRSSGTGNTNLALTSADGAYSFNGLVPGQYRILLGVGAQSQSFFATSPAKVFQGRIEAAVALGSQPLDNLNFGLVRVSSLPTTGGIAWIDAERAAPNPDVKAFIDGTLCGFRRSEDVSPFVTRPSAGVRGFYSLLFLPEQLVTGCGRAGAVVTFTVNGRPANETVIFPPERRAHTLTVGPPFAVYTGNLPFETLRERLGSTAEFRVTAVIAGSACSVHDVFQGTSEISVLPAVLRPGCGVEGALVEFFVDGIKANETAHWTPGFHSLDLTLSASGAPTRISPPDTGDGGLVR